MEGKHRKKIIKEAYPTIRSKPTPLLNGGRGASLKEKVKQKMATEVLRQTPCHNTPIKTYQMEIAGCAEHPAALLPDRSSYGASCTPTEERTQMGKAHGCTPFGLTGSLRIEPHCEQSHSREVKTIEGKKLKTSKRLVRGVPDEKGTPEHLSCHEVQKMTKYEKQPNSIGQELPLLPDRALKGLETPWVSPTGEPFHTVRLWEFENLYVLLKQEVWKTISSFLRKLPLSTLTKHLDISVTILSNIRNNSNQSIHIHNLYKLFDAVNLDLNEIESSIRSIKFGQRGEPEYISFPFTMNIYAWRVLCHIVGDGNVHDRDDRPYPYLRWTQHSRKGEKKFKDIPPKTQRHMRTLLERLSRLPGGSGNEVNYPKALTYCIIGTIPLLKLSDLRTPKFIQFVLDLPTSYHDYKVQFLAAFAIDDGGIDQTINFNQSSLPKLRLVMKLCDQMNYEYSEPYFDKRENVKVWSFRLQLRGIRCLYNDLIEIQTRYSNDSTLGLWHKSHLHQRIVQNISDKRLDDNQRAIAVCECIITIMSDNVVRKTPEIHQHPKINPLVNGYSDKIFLDRLRTITSMNILREVKKSSQISYRPKRWVIPTGRDLRTLLKVFHAKYGDRSHKHSYERKSITVKMTKVARDRLKEKGIRPTPKNTAREIGCSRQVFYRRPDLRALFEDDKDELD